MTSLGPAVSWGQAMRRPDRRRILTRIGDVLEARDLCAQPRRAALASRPGHDAVVVMEVVELLA